MIALLLFVTSLLSSPIWVSPQDYESGQQIVESINNVRKEFLLEPIDFDYEMLHSLRGIGVPKWFIENTTESINFPIIWRNKTIAMRNNYMNGQFLLDKPTSPLWQFYKDYGMQYLFHDTTSTDINSIIEFRVKQMGCFDWSKCLGNEYTRFVSCLKKIPELTAFGSCSWAWYYLPMMLQKDLSRISCILLDNVTSPDVPSRLRNIQTKTFFCYGRMPKIQSDNPF